MTILELVSAAVMFILVALIVIAATARLDEIGSALP
jgi:hypothetical protein